jgi:hypothetical protein
MVIATREKFKHPDGIAIIHQNQVKGLVDNINIFTFSCLAMF